MMQNTHQKFIGYCLQIGKLMRILCCHVFLHFLHIHVIIKFCLDSVVGIAIKLLGQYDFFFPKCPDRLWGPATLLFSGNQGAFSDFRQPGHEAKHTPTPTTDVKNGRSYIFTPYIRLYGVDGNNVTFTFNNSVTVHNVQTKRRLQQKELTL
jgi:hypothetical protein